MGWCVGGLEPAGWRVMKSKKHRVNSIMRCMHNSIKYCFETFVHILSILFFHFLLR